jgi:hypothetical protein
MAISAKMYGSFLKKALNKEIDWDSDDIRVALVTSSYTPDQDAHDYWDDVVANEASGTGYTANGSSLSTKTITYTGASNLITMDADDVSWTTSTVTARYAVIYDRTPATDATRPLLGYVDFGTDMSTVSGTFQITWNASGIFQITVS